MNTALKKKCRDKRTRFDVQLQLTRLSSPSQVLLTQHCGLVKLVKSSHQMRLAPGHDMDPDLCSNNKLPSLFVE